MGGELTVLCSGSVATAEFDGRIYGLIRLYLLFLLSKSVTAISSLEKKEEKE